MICVTSGVYTSTNPQQFSYDMNTGTIGQFTEQVLGVVTVSNGVFEMFVNNGDALNGSNPLYGWAWLRLIPGATLSTPTPHRNPRRSNRDTATDTQFDTHGHPDSDTHPDPIADTF